MNITRAQITKQFRDALSRGWVKLFKNAGQTFGFTTELLMAVASRESNMRNIVGDRGHGFGIMQIDIRSFPDFCRTGKWKDVEQSIMKGAEVLDSKRQFILNNVYKKLNAKTHKGEVYTFSMPEFKGELLTKVYTAAYNSGTWSAYHASKGRDPDFGTTGKDYAKDVLARAKVFAELLNEIDDDKNELSNNLVINDGVFDVDVLKDTAETKAVVKSDGEEATVTETKVETTKTSEGFIQASVGSLKRLWVTITGLGITLSDAVFGWAKDHFKLIVLAVSILVVYMIVQTYLDNKRMNIAADKDKNNVR